MPHFGLRACAPFLASQHVWEAQESRDMVQFALTILLPLTSIWPARASCLSLFPLLLAPQAFRTRLLSPLYPSEDVWFGDGIICVQNGERESWVRTPVTRFTTQM